MPTRRTQSKAPKSFKSTVALLALGGLCVGGISGGALAGNMFEGPTLKLETYLEIMRLREPKAKQQSAPMKLEQESAPIKLEKVTVNDNYDFFSYEGTPQCELDKAKGQLCGRGQVPVYLTKTCSANGQKGRMYICQRNQENELSGPLVHTQFSICGDGICDMREKGCGFQECLPGIFCNTECSLCVPDCGAL